MKNFNLPVFQGDKKMIAIRKLHAPNFTSKRMYPQLANEKGIAVHLEESQSIR
jgi:hypothetical protein